MPGITVNPIVMRPCSSCGRQVTGWYRIRRGSYRYLCTAPIPLSSFAGEPSANVGKNFLRSYAGVCLQGVVIALACIIFSTIAVTDPAVDSSVSAVTAVWSYVGELVFNLLILVGAIKGCDRIVKEIMGL